jgi:hypothetical protein
VPPATPAILSRVDHLVYATADLDRGIAEIERLLGVRASPGGRHPAWGTRNALVTLGPRCYLEIIAPDAGDSPDTGVRPFGLDGTGPSRLRAWAANGTELENFRLEAASRGVVLGTMQSGSRRRADGVVLTWTLTDLRCVVADGVMPFFIDWGTTPHPASAAPGGAILTGLRGEHPDSDGVRRMLRGIGLDLPVSAGSTPALIAEIDCPNGRVILR